MKKKRPLGPSQGFVTRVIIRQEDFPNQKYPFDLPCLTDLEHIDVNPKVTFFVGENGSGKSTLLEAIAVAAGMNPEGGGRNLHFATYETHTKLSDCLTLVKRAFPLDTYFLRAETFYNVASELHRIEKESGGAFIPYGGSPHERSHGESFLALFQNRFGDNGLYLIDEPEAALSPRRQLALHLVIRDLVEAKNSQLIIATHSPILLAYPGATIYEFSHNGIAPIKYADAGCVQVTKNFLADPQRYLAALERLSNA